jgi:hypothetical protein
MLAKRILFGLCGELTFYLAAIRFCKITDSRFLSVVSPRVRLVVKEDHFARLVVDAGLHASQADPVLRERERLMTNRASNQRQRRDARSGLPLQAREWRDHARLQGSTADTDLMTNRASAGKPTSLTRGDTTDRNRESVILQKRIAGPASPRYSHRLHRLLCDALYLADRGLCGELTFYLF